jgi:hypothetical protein
MKIVFSLVALVPAIACAGPFDGTWVTKKDSVKITGKPDTYLLADGMFTCGPCNPSYKVKADGTDQKIKGHPYYDTVSVKEVDANTVEMKTHTGTKPWSDRKFTVSADGKTMTEEFVSYEGPKPIKGKFASTRVAPAPAGASSISGSWKPDIGNTTLPTEYLSVTYAETADGLKMSTPTGQSYDAKFDGKKVLTEGDTGKTMVSLKRIDPQTIQETDSRGGKVTDVFTDKVSADGKTMHVVDKDPIHGTTMTFTAEKQ